MRILCSALLLLLLAACGEDDRPTPPAAPEGAAAAAVPAAPEGAAPAAAPPGQGTLAAFRARMDRLIDVSTKGDDAAAEADVEELLLPDPAAWFTRTFGDTQLARLRKEYSIWEGRVPQLPAEIRRNREAGKTEVLVERFERAGDELATGYQSNALAKMKTPTPLYSVRLLEPGEQDGWHLWSFAWVDGSFRFVGRLMALSPETGSAELARLGSLRIRTAREVLDGK